MKSRDKEINQTSMCPLTGTLSEATETKEILLQDGKWEQTHESITLTPHTC